MPAHAPNVEGLQDFGRLSAQQRAGAQTPDHVGCYTKVRENRVDISVTRSASFEGWHGGLDPLFQNGLGTILRSGERYVTFAHMKTSINTPYDVLVTCVPHEGNPIIHALDEHDADTRTDIFNGVTTAILAIANVAARRGESLTRLYAIQHNALDELGNYPFSTTFPQSHLHVYGVTPNDIQKAESGLPYRELIKRDPGNRHAFFDPTIAVARDLYAERFGAVPYDPKTASLILTHRKLGLYIPAEEEQLYVRTMAEWKKAWYEVASCFTDFTYDDQRRLVPKGQPVREASVENFIQAHAGLGTESRMILRHIARNLTTFDEKFLWNTFANNIHGSLGWTFDFENQTTTLRFAPRTFVVEHKIGATDGYYMSVNKPEGLPDTPDKEDIIAIQKELYAEMRSLH